MFDFSRVKKTDPERPVTVSDLINVLEDYPQDAIVTCCGSEEFFIHVEKDLTTVTIDTDSLPGNYEMDEFDEEKIPIICPVSFATVENSDYEEGEENYVW